MEEQTLNTTEIDTDKFLQSLTEDERRIMRMMGVVWKRHHMTLPEILNGVEKIVQERDIKARSFWRAVFDALWSGVTQAHALLQKLFKE